MSLNLLHAACRSNRRLGRIIILGSRCCLCRTTLTTTRYSCLVTLVHTHTQPRLICVPSLKIPCWTLQQRNATKPCKTPARLAVPVQPVCRIFALATALPSNTVGERCRNHCGDAVKTALSLQAISEYLWPCCQSSCDEFSPSDDTSRCALSPPPIMIDIKSGFEVCWSRFI